MREVLSIGEAFEDLRDPRSRAPAHDLTEMLVVALCAILSGADSWVAVQTWAEAKLEWLRGHLRLANGIASHDTFRRVFAALDAQQFEACFMRWASHLCPVLADEVVAIDGKSVRGSHRGDQRALHLVSAYGSGLGVVLGLSSERRYYISSLPAQAHKLAHAVRSHWRIENSMHWVLDVAFGEDQCRVRVENAAQNFAILRRIAMNLLKRDTTPKVGLRNRASRRVPTINIAQVCSV